MQYKLGRDQRFSNMSTELYCTVYACTTGRTGSLPSNLKVSGFNENLEPIPHTNPLDFTFHRIVNARFRGFD